MLLKMKSSSCVAFYYANKEDTFSMKDWLEMHASYLYNARDME